MIGELKEEIVLTFSDLKIPFLAPRTLELFNLNFQLLEVVSRYRDTQLQVTGNLCDL